MAAHVLDWPLYVRFKTLLPCPSAQLPTSSFLTSQLPCQLLHCRGSNSSHAGPQHGLWGGQETAKVCCDGPIRTPDTRCRRCVHFCKLHGSSAPHATSLIIYKGIRKFQIGYILNTVFVESDAEKHIRVICKRRTRHTPS